MRLRTPVNLHKAARLVGLVLAVLAAGCAANGGVDVATLEQQLQADLVPSHPDVVTSVTCPGEIKPDSGDQVTCVAMIGTTPADVTVTFGAEKGVAAATVDDRLVDVVELSRLAAERLSGDLELPIELACPFPVMVVNVGDEVTCTATDERRVERELGLMVDEAGLVSIRLK